MLKIQTEVNISAGKGERSGEGASKIFAKKKKIELGIKVSFFFLKNFQVDMGSYSSLKDKNQFSNQGKCKQLGVATAAGKGVP